MARSTIEIGTTPNDGTGDTLRDAGTKINNNFAEIYERLGGDSSSSTISFLGNDLVFAGGVDDGYETKLSPTEPTADNVIVVPNASGTLVLTTATQTLTNKTLTTPSITSPVMTTPKITGGSYQYQFAVGSLAANRTITLPTLTANDTFTFNTATQTLTNKTLTAAKADHLDDTNGARVIDFTATASAVNHFAMANAASGNGVTLSAHTEGTDSDIDMNINAYNKGTVTISKMGLGTKELTGTDATTYGKSVYFLNKSSAMSVSVTNGRTVGEVRHFIATNASTGTMTLSFTSKVGTNPLTLTTQGDAVSVIWDGTYWYEF